MFVIQDRLIGQNYPPYIVAELSANHNGSIEKAKETILAAKNSGADAIKIQTYTAETMTIDSDKEDFLIKGGPWNGYKLYDLYNEAGTPFEWHKELFKYSEEIGITIFSTPFDEKAVDLLEDLNCPAYKIASFELTDLPLIKYVSRTKKPILMSTGMATEKEIFEAVEIAKSNGCNDLLLFHCISSYPAPTNQSNINMITTLKKRFDVEVGLSDHTLNNISAIASIALGACAIEKHFIIDRNQKGPDSSFSIEPKELDELVKTSYSCWECLGKGNFERAEVELKSKNFRRSIYFVKDMKEGQKITFNDIRRIRPGFGMPPKFFDQVLNKKVLKDIYTGDRVTWDILSD